MIVKSFAKINLSLSIKGKRDDGYHYLEMVNLPLALHDTIEITHTPYLKDTFVTCDEPHLNALHHNLCTKAVQAMREYFGFNDNFIIHIHKEIPFAAGLGGGSSNAAAVMLAIDKILKLNAPSETLNLIGASLGADVPYFLACAPALVTGIGEIDTPIKAKDSYEVLLLKPDEGLSTADVYKNCDEFERLSIDTRKVVKGLETGNPSLIAEGAGNDLYPCALKRLPVIGEYISMLKEDGFFYVAMSGSGSAVFALTQDPKIAKAAYKKYEKKGLNVILTKTIK